MSFAPPRLYPRFAAVADLASLVPRGLPAFGRLGSHVFDLTPADGDRWDPRRPPRAAVVGFPRTGSTFLTAATEMWAGEAVPHLHDVLCIPRLATADVRVLVPLRNPLDTVLSWSIYNGDAGDAARLRARLHTYAAWHRKLLRIATRTSVLLTRFEDFTADPTTPLQRLLGDRRPPLTADEVRGQLASTERDERWAVSRLPADERRHERARFEGALATPSVQRLLEQATVLYTRAVRQTGDHEALQHEPLSVATWRVDQAQLSA